MLINNEGKDLLRPPFQDMDYAFGEIPVFSKSRIFPTFGEIPNFSHFWTNPGFSKSRVFPKTRTFHKYMLFKTSSITSRYKMPLEDYKEHFEVWLKDLKKTGGYQPIVERHEYNWSNIYSDLNRLFKDEVWNHVLEQRARERDQYNDRVAKSTGDRFLHRPTERRTDHISLF